MALPFGMTFTCLFSFVFVVGMALSLQIVYLACTPDILPMDFADARGRPLPVVGPWVPYGRNVSISVVVTPRRRLSHSLIGHPHLTVVNESNVMVFGAGETESVFRSTLHRPPAVASPNHTMKAWGAVWKRLDAGKQVYLHATLRFGEDKAVTTVAEFVQHMVPHKKTLSRSLITDDTQESDQNMPIAHARAPHWMHHADVNLIQDNTLYPVHKIPPLLQPALHARTDSQGSKQYEPVVTVNRISPEPAACVWLNHTESALPLRVTLRQMSLQKFLFLETMAQSISLLIEHAQLDSKDFDEVAHMLQDNYTWVLALTMVVSFVHMLLDILAIKNDITYWRARKTGRGISTSTMFSSLVCQAVVALYLWNESASWLVLGPAMAGIAIQTWKLYKVNFSVAAATPKTVATTTPHVRDTSEYDKTATRFLLKLLSPCMVAVGAYSVLYKSYRSWFDFALGTAVSWVYMFGFVMMTPQIYINYKLQSVEHLPWSMLVYKFLSTIIDDLFAFIIKMPTLHRISAFRDDVVFVVYLYQRWAYRVDPTRTPGGMLSPPSSAKSGEEVTQASTRKKPEHSKDGRVEEREDEQRDTSE